MKTDRERAEDLAKVVMGAVTTIPWQDPDRMPDHLYIMPEIEAAFAEREAEIRKEYEDLSCSKCGNPWGDGWLPIETAPKNTRLILTFDFESVFIGADDNNDGLWYDGGWGTPTPTHWMPLPPSPKG